MILGSGLALPAAAAEDSATLQVTKTVATSNGQTEFAPGDSFDYEISVGCSTVVDEGCIDAFVLDTLPAPLVLDPTNPSPVAVSLSPAGTADIAITGDNEFRVTPKHTFAGGTGVLPSATMLITVSVYVPTTVSGEFNGDTVTNTASADATNALEASDSADITLAVKQLATPSNRSRMRRCR